MLPLCGELAFRCDHFVSLPDRSTFPVSFLSLCGCVFILLITLNLLAVRFVFSPGFIAGDSGLWTCCLTDVYV